MSDIVVTVPKTFRHVAAPDAKGLAAWCAEGDCAGAEWSGELWGFTVAGPRPDIRKGDRVYIVCEDLLRGYAPLVDLVQLGDRYWELVRGGGAVGVTLPQKVVGFRGWRRRWWEREAEIPFPNWRTATIQTVLELPEQRLLFEGGGG